MAMFDPKKAKDDSSNKGIPAGDYLLAMKRFERRTSKTKKPYLHALFVVIAGAAKKRTFFDNISLDMQNSGAMFRLSMLAEQCGVEEAFDLDDDSTLREKLCWRPFKARVSRKLENGYVNNGIERYLMGEAITENDRKLMEEWVLEHEADAEVTGNGGGYDDRDDVPPPGDDDFGGGYSGRGGRQVDDDIPF